MTFLALPVADVCRHIKASRAQFVQISATRANRRGSRLQAALLMHVMSCVRRFVYDGEVEAQMTMVFDANKRLMPGGVSDIYPGMVLLGKGEYTVRAWLRHDDVPFLDKLRALPAVVHRKLKDTISVPVYPAHTAAIVGKHALSKVQNLHAGNS